MHVPTGPWDPWKDPFTGWMPLAYHAAVTASSAQPGHGPQLAVDEDVRTFWAAADKNGEAWLRVDLGAVATLHAVQVNFAEHGCTQYGRADDGDVFHRYVLEGSLDGETWTTVIDRTSEQRDTPHDFHLCDAPVRLRFARLRIIHMAAGGWPAVSGLRLFGLGDQAPPDAPTGLQVVRDADDPCVARVTWDHDPQAIGYNVRWGIDADKLYCDWLVYGRHDLTLRCLSAGQSYVLSVEAFNASGVSPCAQVVRC